MTTTEYITIESPSYGIWFASELYSTPHIIYFKGVYEGEEQKKKLLREATEIWEREHKSSFVAEPIARVYHKI